MALLSFSGTDLIGQDDLTASPWSDTGYLTTALFGTATGPAGTDAYTATVDDPGNPGFQAIRAINITSASETDHEVFIWCRAGTATTWEGGLNQAGWHVQSAVIVSGPGTAEVISDRVYVRGLESESWTLVKFADNLASATTGGDLIIYPGTLSQSAGDSIRLGRCRVSVASDGADWVWDSLDPAVSIRSADVNAVKLTGFEYVSSDTASSIARNRTMIFPAYRGSSSAMTLAEQVGTSTNYWRLHVAANGSIVFNCVIDSVNIGASTAAGVFNDDEAKDIAVVIPSTGNAIIYVNAQDVTDGSAGTLTVSTEIITWGARFDGSEPWVGHIYPARILATAMTAGEVSLAYYLQTTETTYAKGQMLHAFPGFSS